MNGLFLVMIGGAMGSALRYVVGLRLTRWLGAGYPYGILSVNVLGGLAMGVLVGLLANSFARTGQTGEPWRLLLGVGVLGGFTTFSSFSLDAWQMLARGQTMAALGYIILSVVGAIGALALGLTVVRGLA